LTGFNDQARNVLARAEDEARRLNHEYLGTEHMLLGLIAAGSREVAAAFRSLGVDPARLRREIAALVQPGANAVTLEALPQTPRARQALEFAELEALLMNSPHVAPEHLLLGLMREPDGVAGRVLQNLGLTLQRLTAEVFKTRLLQSTLVERIVRPVRAGTARKRKMRDELLSHLLAIYDQELTRLDDPAAAWREAAIRFGDPAELTRELESSLPRSARREYYYERWFGWRAPESAARWSFRLAAQLFVMLAIVVGIGSAASILLAGWGNLQWRYFRGAAAFLLLLPATVGTWVILCEKMRDAMFGVFGSRKSPFRVLLSAAAITLAVVVAGVCYMAITEWDFASAIPMLVPYSFAGIATGVAAMLIVRFNGLTEIRDTVWACMDLDRPILDDPDSPLSGNPPVEPA